MGKRILVVLDPGHYPNYNRGAVSGYYEGNKMYDFSEYERDALRSYGIDVIITRNRANDMGLYNRGQVAVKNGKGYDVVIFKSNHSNAYKGNACGVVVYRSAHLPGSADLGQKLVDAIVGVMRPVTGVTYSRGVATRKQSNGADYYGVIRGSVSGATNQSQAKKGPVDYSFIVEHGFHDNVKECSFLMNNDNLKKMAEAEAKVIANYFGITTKGATTVNSTISTSKNYLSKGDKGNDVKTMQTMLIAVGISCGSSGADGSFGPDTEQAVKTYQAQNGLEVDGCYGPLSKASLTAKYNAVKNGSAFKVRVKINDLNIRTGAGTNYARVNYIKPGVYTIVEVKSGKGSVKGWGKLKSGAGWISLDFAERV